MADDAGDAFTRALQLALPDKTSAQVQTLRAKLDDCGMDGFTAFNLYATRQSMVRARARARARAHLGPRCARASAAGTLMRVRVQDANIPMEGELSWFRAGQRDRVAQMIRGAGVVARAGHRRRRRRRSRRRCPRDARARPTRRTWYPQRRRRRT